MIANLMCIFRSSVFKPEHTAVCYHVVRCVGSMTDESGEVKVNEGKSTSKCWRKPRGCPPNAWGLFVHRYVGLRWHCLLSRLTGVWTFVQQAMTGSRLTDRWTWMPTPITYVQPWSNMVTVAAVFVCRELLSSLAEESGSGALCDWYQKPYDWFDGIVLQPPISDITGLFLIARYYAISSISTPRRWADGSRRTRNISSSS